MRQHADLVQDLGGVAEIAERLNLKRDHVRKWATQGIPWRWRPHLVPIAKEKGIALPKEFLPGVAPLETVQ